MDTSWLPIEALVYGLRCKLKQWRISHEKCQPPYTIWHHVWTYRLLTRHKKQLDWKDDTDIWHLITPHWKCSGHYASTYAVKGNSSQSSISCLSEVPEQFLQMHCMSSIFPVTRILPPTSQKLTTFVGYLKKVRNPNSYTGVPQHRSIRGPCTITSVASDSRLDSFLKELTAGVKRKN